MGKFFGEYLMEAQEIYLFLGNPSNNFWISECVCGRIPKKNHWRHFRRNPDLYFSLKIVDNNYEDMIQISEGIYGATSEETHGSSSRGFLRIL